MTFVLLTIGAQAWAQTDMIPKVAVVDTNVIYQVANAGSEAVRKLEVMREKFNNEIKKQQEIIETMKNRLLEAEEKDDKNTVRDLTRRIRIRENDLNNYRQTAASELKKATEAIKVDPDTLSLMKRAIELVANRRGYSLVFSSSGTGIVYWSTQIDITREVSAEVLNLQKS